MPKPLIRIPYTGALPPPLFVPRTSNTRAGALAALQTLLRAPTLGPPATAHGQTVILSGAGVSVASGLADYRGEAGTYTLNKTYRPIYYGEFLESHAARQRYWARSFLGWTTLHRARPNAAHRAIQALGELGYVSSVITQNVDSFHARAHPALPTVELHGYLRALVCVQCGREQARDAFQQRLAALNPTWAAFLAEMLRNGALNTEDPAARRARGLRTNPDGDVDLPDAPFDTFRYPACERCREERPGDVRLDADGAWAAGSTAGVLKPAVVMFGESLRADVKAAAERAVDDARALLVVGSSLATYSAWRLVKRARERDMPVGIVNMGGVRGEPAFFAHVAPGNRGEQGVRCSEKAEIILPELAQLLRGASSAPRTGPEPAVPKLPSFGRLE